jgi:hypothetical protein
MDTNTSELIESVHYTGNSINMSTVCKQAYYTMIFITKHLKMITGCRGSLMVIVDTQTIFFPVFNAHFHDTSQYEKES